MGLLPALQAQYLIAGIVPGLGIWVTYLVFSHKPSLQRFASEWLSPSAPGYKKIGFWTSMAAASLTLFIPIFLFEYLLDPVLPRGVRSTIALGSFFLILPGTYGLYASFVSRGTRTRGMREWSRRFNDFLGAYIMPVTLVGLTIYVYVVFWYPNIPQALGGVSPSCAYLDVEKADLSQETLIALFPEEAIESKSEVVKSSRLRVFFVSSNVMLVKHGLNSPTHEIERRIVRAATSC